MKYKEHIESEVDCPYCRNIKRWLDVEGYKVRSGLRAKGMPWDRTEIRRNKYEELPGLLELS